MKQSNSTIGSIELTFRNDIVWHHWLLCYQF